LAKGGASAPLTPSLVAPVGALLENATEFGAKNYTITKRFNCHIVFTYILLKRTNSCRAFYSLFKFYIWNVPIKCIYYYLCRVYTCFDDQERNLTIVKTDFQVLKLKFHACNFKQAFCLLHKSIIALPW